MPNIHPPEIRSDSEILLQSIDETLRKMERFAASTDANARLVEARTTELNATMARLHRRRTGVLTVMLGVFFAMMLVGAAAFVVMTVVDSNKTYNSPGGIRPR